MSGYKLRDSQKYLVPSTPEGEEDFADASGLELFETPAARSFMEQSWAEVKKNTPPKMIDESVQEDDVNSAEEEDLENSNRPDTSCAEITEDEDEVDKSQTSYRGSLSPYKWEKASKQQAHHVFTEDSEEESSDESDEDVSYHIREQRLESGEKYSSSHIGDPDESYQVIKAGRNQAMVIRSSEENSAETSDVEDYAIPKPKASATSSLSPEDFFRSSSKKKVRNVIDSDSDCSAEATPSFRRKVSVTSEESDASAEATPSVRRKASVTSEESDAIVEATPSFRRKVSVTSEESDAIVEATPSVRRKVSVTSEESDASAEATPSVRRKASVTSEESDASAEATPSVRRKVSVTSEESDASAEATPYAYRGRAEKKAESNVKSGEEDTEEEEVITKISSGKRNRIVDSDVSTEEEVEPITLPSTSRIPTPRMLHQTLLTTSRDRHDSGNDSNMDPLNGTHESSRKSGDKRFSPPETLAEEVSIHDLSNSILEVSSTVESFSSAEVQEQDESITEIISPESARAPPAVAQISAAEIMRLREDLTRQNLVLKSSNLKSLPDGGARLKENVRMLTERLEAANKLKVYPSARSVPVSSASAVSTEVQEDELRKKIQMKKWAMGNANAIDRDRLRNEIRGMEGRLAQLSIAHATNAGQSASGSSSYSKYSDKQNETLNRQSSAEKQNGIKLLPELPKLTDMQKKMFADNAGKELYKKSESGYISAAARREAVSITLDSLENLHRSLASCPKETDKESTPSCLTVPLLSHQERALKWLLWRETQVPAGGILADDMGLGKTLTMISLIVRQKELDPPPPASSDIWLSKTVKIKRSSGTLVVCPASVVGQWEKEIQRRCKRNSLSIVIFHGADRNKYAAKLHQYDIVITTYQIVSREISNVSLDKKDGDSKPIGDFNVETDANAIRQSVLLQIAFDRIILDEAHVIRNPKAGVSQAVCRLRASRRWVVTGTPVQNKELDMYSLLRFLRVTPFDQLAVWKRWVDNSKSKNDAQAQGRLQLLIKTLLLRRTKDQKVEGSETPLVAMPSREVHTHQVQLSQEENAVYQKLLAFSRKALEEYIKNQENKIKEGYGFTYDRSNLPELPQKNVTKQMMLVLLLRLRQVCSHPALIQTMLDATETDALGSEEAKIEDNDLDLITQMSTMTLGGEPNEQKKEEEENFFTHTNPVFDREKMSSKMRYIIDEVQKVVSQKQKAVVVSQWTSMLDLFAQQFRRLHIRCHLIAGSVALKHRTDIVEDFNRNPDGPPVILLSLGAGGVGLNLIGGNHIFIADMHWNPQLEAQACDRVYRVGQTKDVHVHRMITQGTVEERILQLQQSKLAMANGILTGAAKLATKGLTIDDLKMLFNPGPPAYAPKPMLNPPEF